MQDRDEKATGFWFHILAGTRPQVFAGFKFF
jgi:hypothetical protein